MAATLGVAVTLRFRRLLADAGVASAGARESNTKLAAEALSAWIVIVAVIDPAVSETTISDGSTPVSWLNVLMRLRDTASMSIESIVPSNVTPTTTSWISTISRGGGDGDSGGGGDGDGGGGGGGDGDGGGGGGGNGDGGGGDPWAGGDGDANDVAGGGGEGAGGGGDGDGGGGKGSSGGEGDGFSVQR